MFISYFILLSTVKFLNIKIKRFRLILASLLGGLYSLIIFVPHLHLFFSILLKLVLSALIIFASIGFCSKKMFLKALAVFYLINFVFFAVMFLLWQFSSPNSLLIKNDIVYLNISPIFLAISTIVCYIVFNQLNKIAGKSDPKKTFCDIIINFGNKEKNIRAKIDTGNSLKEPFSSLPVIVAEYSSIEDLAPKEVKNFLLTNSLDLQDSLKEKPNLKIIPFRAISGTGILPAFKPDKILLKSEEKPLLKEAYVAVCKKGTLPIGFKAIMSEELLV
jgi:stage II sporulation protein GA (sporulation sigma-E factor processing peptidase)